MPMSDESSRRMQTLEIQYVEVIRRLSRIEQTVDETLAQTRKTNGRVNAHSWQIKTIIAVLTAIGIGVWWVMQALFERYLGTLPR